MPLPLTLRVSLLACIVHVKNACFFFTLSLRGGATTSTRLFVNILCVRVVLCDFCCRTLVVCVLSGARTCEIIIIHVNTRKCLCAYETHKKERQRASE